jgi:hypothetical protein
VASETGLWRVWALWLRCFISWMSRIIASARGLWENVNDEVKHGIVANTGEVRIIWIDDIKGDLAREIYLLIFA